MSFAQELQTLRDEFEEDKAKAKTSFRVPFIKASLISLFLQRVSSRVAIRVPMPRENAACQGFWGFRGYPNFGAL